MKFYTNEPFFRQLDEMLNKKLHHEPFLPTKIILMPRDLYKKLVEYTYGSWGLKSISGMIGLDTAEDGGQFCGANIRIYDIIDGESDMTKGWLKKANDSMEKRGTKGAFTAQAKKAGGVKKGGGIKDSFIDKELHSSNPTTRKRAQFAKNMKKIARGK